MTSKWTADELLPHIVNVLGAFVDRYPAFTAKPVGANESAAREQQMQDIAREEMAKVLIERAKLAHSPRAGRQE